MSRPALFGVAEKDMQAAVVALYEFVGVDVTVTSWNRGASTLPAGVPDLILLLPDGRGAAFHETKAPKGKQSGAQIRFQAKCAHSGTPYILGGVEEARSWLTATGILT